ncbi:dihydroorotate oxidase [Candidatus Woesearchaeota archaeon]|nr:dihydroorotate oxidase [Candidatus Woesearchaeota archaeon]
MIDLSTTITGIKLKNPLMNASGALCMTKEELHELGASSSGAFISKSCTLLARDGNPEPRYADFSGGSINSMGLPNPGYQFYTSFFPELAKYTKPLFASVSGLSLADNVQIIKTFSEVKALSAIELNLSCPNVPGKPQVGYDFEHSAEYIHAVSKICKKPLGVKLPPYFDFAHFEQMAAIINKSNIAFVTCINSLGNGLVIDPAKEQVVIKPKGGYGGIGGSCVKPIALSNVHKFRELLKPSIQVIGCGGVTSGTDVFEHLLAGADVVQVGTTLVQYGPKVFDRLLKELEIIMKKKQYSSLVDCKGKLKQLS